MRYAVCFMFLAAPIWAECPKPADLAKTGIAITLTDQSVTTITAQGSETREHTTFAANPEALVLYALHGVLPLRSHQARDGAPLPGSENTTKWTKAEGLFPLAPGTMKTVEGLEVRENNPSTSVRVTLRASVQRTLSWSGCTVSAMPVTPTYRYPDGSGEQTLLEYLPDYGMSVYIGGGHWTKHPGDMT